MGLWGWKVGLGKGRPYRTRKDQWCPRWGGDEDDGQGGLEISVRESMSYAKGIQTKEITGDPCLLEQATRRLDWASFSEMGSAGIRQEPGSFQCLSVLSTSSVQPCTGHAGHPRKGTRPLPLCVILHRLPVLPSRSPSLVPSTACGPNVRAYSFRPMALETLNKSLATSARHAKASHIHIDYAESSDSRLQISAAVCIIDMNFCSILPPVPLHAPTPYYPGTLNMELYLESSDLSHHCCCESPSSSQHSLWLGHCKAFLTGLPQGSLS